VGKCGLLKGNLTAIVPTAGGEKQYDSVSAHLALRAVLAGWCALSVLDEVERATYFAHALEATHHLVQAAYVHEYETVAPNRESLRAWYKDLYPGYLADAYARICATDDAYTEAVSRAVRMPKGWYVGCVRDVRDAIPAIVEFMRNHLAYEDAMATPPEA
jgi:hypothetical protein